MTQQRSDVLNSGPEVNIRIVNQRHSVSSFILYFDYSSYSPKVLRQDGGGTLVDIFLSIAVVAASEAIPLLVLVEAKQSKAK